ncbi:hypothetical protein FPV67DRAFT_1450681 [Lyophyllum atratum]|nr:hypothetical protein FPV67DRAFT_1450681 [Lyophyllum atratum]
MSGSFQGPAIASPLGPISDAISILCDITDMAYCAGYSRSGVMIRDDESKKLMRLRLDESLVFLNVRHAMLVTTTIDRLFHACQCKLNSKSTAYDAVLVSHNIVVGAKLSSSSKARSNLPHPNLHANSCVSWTTRRPNLSSSKTTSSLSHPNPPANSRVSWTKSTVSSTWLPNMKKPKKAEEAQQRATGYATSNFTDRRFVAK